ncbi:MAG: serine hydrolase, partial [Bacteroidota bacterium]
VNAGSGNSSAGSMSARAFGHTGFTGTSLWVDPETSLFVVLLTNRVHPTRRNSRIRDVRTALSNALADAVATESGNAPAAWGFGPLPDDLPTVAQR